MYFQVMKRASMQFLPGNRIVTFGDESSVLDVALKNKIDLAHSCGGMGSCTTCRVVVESDPAVCSPRTELEEEIANSRQFTERERLSCQFFPHNGLIVRIPEQRDEPAD